MRPGTGLQPMAYLVIVASSVWHPGCALEPQHHVGPEDTTWIQRDESTRAEILRAFGEPDVSIALKGELASWEYAQYGHPVMQDIYEGPGYTSPFEPRPRGGGPGQLGGAAPQVHRPPLESVDVPDADEPTHPFWVLYDPRGIVRAFGFGPPPTELQLDLKDG